MEELEPAGVLMLRVVRLEPPAGWCEFYGPARWHGRPVDPHAGWDARWAWLHDDEWERGACRD